MAAAEDLSVILTRVLIVSRRCLRKNKFVDFVGEYHLDLIVSYGAVPVIVPRVSGVHMFLNSFEPIHGVLLCEGEDIGPSLYAGELDATEGLSPAEMDEIRWLHSSDTAIDQEKDTIEMRLAKLCLERNIPCLGICRGSQVLNVACGGTLYQDVERELTSCRSPNQRVVHVNYDDYDGHRHPVRILEKTPLHEWFKETEIMVNSYHHQGVKRLAQRFVPMSFALDGLVEGFYDPDAYNPDEGKFIMGLQFHPERMRKPGSDEFNYPGCPSAYRVFVRAVIAYQKRLLHRDNDVGEVMTQLPKLDLEMEKKRKVIMKSFSLAKNLYNSVKSSSNPSDLKAGAEFLELNTAKFGIGSLYRLQLNTALSLQQEKRLKQMGATVRNAGSYIERLRLNEDREKMARNVMGKMTLEQLSDLVSFYRMMEQICTEVIECKLHDMLTDPSF